MLDGAISAAWASGQAMTLEQAVAYALEEAPATPDRQRNTKSLAF